ncbi:MAG: class I SAM-dependent methyltransferase [Solirubrobacterales bacterium]
MEGAGEGSRFKAFEVEGWNRRAETYGEMLGGMTARVAEPLLDAAGVRHDMRVLDLATGPGYVAERAAARGALPIGVDIAERMLALARTRQPTLEFRRADAENLPFEDGSFDAVVGGFVLNHLPAPELALAEAIRVLSRGGSAAYSVWDRPERNRFMGVVSDAVGDVAVEPVREVAEGPDPYRFSDDAEFEALLRGAGVDEVVVETLSMTLAVPDADALWEGFMGASVRVRATVDAQSDDVRGTIREAFEHRVEAHRHPDGLELPAVVKLASGRLA